MILSFSHSWSLVNVFLPWGRGENAQKVGYKQKSSVKFNFCNKMQEPTESSC